MTKILSLKRSVAFVLAIAILAGAYAVLSSSAAYTPVASAASVDYFLKIDGIDGESKDEKHKDQIEILSWSWGMSNTSASSAGRGGAGAGKVSMRDFSFVHAIDKATPKLLLACASGEHIKKAELSVRKAGADKDYYMITLEDVLCTKLDQNGEQGATTEQISLNYSKIKVKYLTEARDGTVEEVLEAGWDVKANKSI